MIDALEDLVEAFSKLPSVGKKSAWRLALFILDNDESLANELAHTIKQVKQKIITCKECFNYSETEICSVCSSTTRNKSIICVVEKPVDVFSIIRFSMLRF